MTRCILAHDLGTTGDKATLFDADGALLASAFDPYPTAFPRAGWAEQQPEHWWRAFCATNRQALERAGVPARDIACVVFSGQMMGMVAVDRRARPLHEALIWADQRAVAEIADVATRIDPARVYAITGHRLSPSYSAGKMLWLRRHQRARYDETYKFVQAKDYVVSRLTGAFVTDPSDASSTNLYSLEDGAWSPELVDAFALPVEKLPEIRPSTAVVGEVQPAVAEESGLHAGTPVVIGGGDGACAAAGAGVVRAGVAYNYIGSSSWIGIATDAPILDPLQRTFTWAHLVPGMFTPTGTMQAAGSSFQWARDQLAPEEKEAAARLGLSAYDLMNLQAEQAPPGARGLIFLPYLLGERSPRWNPLARGGFIGLTVRHGRPELIRAVLEGITYNLRVILDAFLAQGTQIASLRVIGGGAQSALWNAIMADVFGIPVLRLSLLGEATSTGAALAGGIGVGIWPDFDQIDRLVRVERVTEPDARRHAHYAALYDTFNRIYTALEDAGVFASLDAADSVLPAAP